MKNFIEKSFYISLFIILFSKFLPAQSVISSKDSIQNLLLSKLDSIQKKIDSLSTNKIADRTFYFSVGGNLNFLENPKINGLYYDVGTFIPKLSGKPDSLIKKEKTLMLDGKKSKNSQNKTNSHLSSASVFWSRVGLEASLQQGRFTSALDSIQSLNRQSLIEQVGSDSALILSQTYKYNTETIPSYLTLTLAPTFRLGDKSPVYFVFHTDFIRNTTIYNTEVTISDQDTIEGIIKPSLPPAVSNGKNRRDIKEFNFNYAFGLKLLYKHKDIILDIKPVIGYGSISPAYGKRKNGVFYLTHFEVNHQKGFKIAGELRGIVGNKTPLASVYLAKTFSFESLIGLFK